MSPQMNANNNNLGVNGQFGDTTYTKVFVGGLAWETQRDTMRKYFEQFGDILEAVVITDKNTGRSKGYGFVCILSFLFFFLLPYYLFFLSSSFFYFGKKKEVCPLFSFIQSLLINFYLFGNKLPLLHLSCICIFMISSFYTVSNWFSIKRDLLQNWPLKDQVAIRLFMSHDCWLI